MRISKLLWRNRNDFHFEAECDCGKTSRWGDGYADAYYQQVVFPNRHCEHCGLNEFGEAAKVPDAAPVAEPSHV